MRLKAISKTQGLCSENGTLCRPGTLDISCLSKGAQEGPDTDGLRKTDSSFPPTKAQFPAVKKKEARWLKTKMRYHFSLIRLAKVIIIIRYQPAQLTACVRSFCLASERAILLNLQDNPAEDSSWHCKFVNPSWRTIYSM
jgi:hypothetical protein